MSSADSDCSSDERSRDFLTDESTIVELMIEHIRSGMKTFITVATAFIRIAINEEDRNKFIKEYEIHLKAEIINEILFLKGDKVSELLAKQSMIRASKTNFVALNGNAESLIADIDNIEYGTKKAIEDSKSEITEEEIQAHPMFKKLQENINEILVAAQLSQQQQANNEDLDDSVAGEEYIPTVDPITKGPLMRPIKNSICGHVYGKSAIKKMLRFPTAKFRCPYMGCSNKDFIQKEHLIKDAALAAKIRDKIAKQREWYSDRFETYN